ncbi:Uncharacterized phage-associated protein [Fructobacillus fructosus]|uniref:Contains DUF4065 domain (GepA) n=1 Tax=Fructobacillus tropaeoli TaxID=709323 RepID=A0ABM9MUP8_9LACO|nr:Uncharacterized phage-associated protein [Fructobacillus tropaeoli]CAK1241303.1 Uncharacterized phage-associated protein [Fructobacillus tropaeoli]CAK1248907.1 Uncharacterized phage-associated protein [Fructobacillus fructosus]CAK1249653.1 Uncharacterized phage-associated protein [Fructobacillus fructosus]
MEQYSVFDVAKWFLSKEALTPKKIQKLTYYAEAWSYALFGKPLLNDTHFEAWVHGPVSPILYNKYKEYGWNTVPKETNVAEFDEQVADLLESVWATYGDKSANELESLTHTETPWKQARQGCGEYDSSSQRIDPELMKSYYRSMYIGD